MLNYKARILATIPLGVFLSTTAIAQDKTREDEGASEPAIIVTAQKREQDLLDVPLSLSVQDTEEIRRERSTNAYDIVRQVPGVTGSNPNSELTQIAIRGVSSEDYGIGSDPTVGVFFDGVYLGRNENTGVDFIDLERAEIARGPQGALFGRATPGGAISLVPVRPYSDFESRGSLEVGSDGFVQASLIGNVPISDNIFLRGSAIYSRAGNFVENLSNGNRLGAEESGTARLALRYEASPDTTIDLTGWIEKSDGEPWLYRNFTETVEDPEDIEDLSSRFDFIDEVFSDVPASELISNQRAWGTILSVEHIFENDIRLVATSSAIGYNSEYTEDFDGTDLFLLNFSDFGEQSLLTQEVRLVSSDTAAVRWLAGAVLYRESVDSTITQSYGDFDLCVFFEFDDEDGCAPAGNGVTDTFIFAEAENKGFALFAETVFDLTDRLIITAGLRYTWDNKELLINAPTPGGFLPADEVGFTIPTDGLDVLREETFTSWQPRVALTFRPSDSVSIYGLYSEGEKPGGFDTFDPFSPAFNPEEVQTFEIGTKGAVIDGRLTYAIAAYITDYSELQVLVSDGPRDIVKNAASANAKGIELEVRYAHNGFELGLRGAVSEAEFQEFVDLDNGIDFSGNRLAYTPEWSIGGTIGYERQLGSDWKVFGRIDADIQGRQFLTPDNDLFASNPAYERVDLSMGLGKGDSFEIYAFGQNVTSSDFVGIGDVTNNDNNFGAYLAQFPRPSIFGIGVSVSTF